MAFSTDQDAISCIVLEQITWTDFHHRDQSLAVRSDAAKFLVYYQFSNQSCGGRKPIGSQLPICEKLHIGGR